MKRPLMDDMVFVPGGLFAMGSERFYPEEAPVRNVQVDGFWMDVTPVTNRQFARFVEATGYRTLAEESPDPRLYPGMLPELAQPGALVFKKQDSIPSDGGQTWWHYVPGAHWRCPQGPGSSVEGIEDHPVVQVAWRDVDAYARWAGKALPSEAEFEFAARGGLVGKDYAWGDELAPGGQMMANYWQGLFPVSNLCLDGYEGTSPVRAFAPNAYGLFDLIGNTWEWTQDWWADQPVRGPAKKKASCCAPRNPRGGTLKGSRDPGDPTGIPRRVMKGGSHLCADNYCRRYRPAARHPQQVDTATSHLSFRCVVRAGKG